jgi:hypothetical protein
MVIPRVYCYESLLWYRLIIDSLIVTVSLVTVKSEKRKDRVLYLTVK